MSDWPSREREVIVCSPSMPGELLLEHLGDPGLDDAGGGADIAGLDRDDRRIDVGIFAHRQAEEADDPDHRDQHRDHRREDRAA